MDWQVNILKTFEDYRFGRLFKIIRAELQHRLFDGRMSEPVTRINFERGDSVAVLLYDEQRDSVILVRQFRYPVYASLSSEERQADASRAWLLEIVAGVRDKGVNAQEVAHKELLEEAGYKVHGELERISTIYASPGGTSERITIFLGHVDFERPAAAGGGVVAEGEDIQVVVLPLEKAMQMIETGEIRDAKTIVALQHLVLRKSVGSGAVQKTA